MILGTSVIIVCVFKIFWEVFYFLELIWNGKIENAMGGLQKSHHRIKKTSKLLLSVSFRPEMFAIAMRNPSLAVQMKNKYELSPLFIIQLKFLTRNLHVESIPFQILRKIQIKFRRVMDFFKIWKAIFHQTSDI